MHFFIVFSLHFFDEDTNFSWPLKSETEQNKISIKFVSKT